MDYTIMVYVMHWMMTLVNILQCICEQCFVNGYQLETASLASGEENFKKLVLDLSWRPSMDASDQSIDRLVQSIRSIRYLKKHEISTGIDPKPSFFFSG